MKKTENKTSVEVGACQEQRAADFLRAHNVKIWKRNYRAGRTGEVDIIGTDEKILVFFEVKYRSSACFGSPEEAVDLRKQRSICRTAVHFMQENKISGRQVRFDVIAVEGEEIRWIRDAFPYCPK